MMLLAFLLTVLALFVSKNAISIITNTSISSISVSIIVNRISFHFRWISFESRQKDKQTKYNRTTSTFFKLSFSFSSSHLSSHSLSKRWQDNYRIKNGRQDNRSLKVSFDDARGVGWATGGSLFIRRGTPDLDPQYQFHI